jgi:hypothetical protein
VETPAVYSIRVRGHVDINWFSRLGGMSVSLETADTITILEGYLPDQAALSGVLNTLYDLHHPLLSVECLDEKR